MTRRQTLAAAAAALVLASAGAASAAVTELAFAAPGAVMPQIYFNGFVPGTTTVDPALSATLDLSLLSITGGGYQWNFSYSLANTSTAPSRISVFGWDIGTDVLAVVGVDGDFGSAASGNMASLGGRDFCLKDGGGGNCSGGGGGGLSMGESGSGVFSLTFLDHTTSYVTVQTPKYNKKGELTGYTDTQIPVTNPVAAPASIAFNNFGLRMQSLANGQSTVAVPGDRPLIPMDPGTGVGIPVPEPATWAMMILGFGAVGAMLRRRARVPA